MQLHELRPKTKFRTSRRVGRGGKRGTTAGRGTKGQKARAGAKIRPAIRDIIKKLPKRRGYRFHSFQERSTVVALVDIAKHFPNGATVDREALIAKGLARRVKGRTPMIKVLGGDTLKKKLTFRGLNVSRATRDRILEAGGEIR